MEIEVIDNGIGIPPLLKPAGNGGIGLKSIRDRTAELGGQCFVGRIDTGGTQVRAVLPLMQGEEKS